MLKYQSPPPPPPPPPASMLVHEATVCRSVSFICASKVGVLECVMGQGKLKWLGGGGVLMLTHK